MAPVTHKGYRVRILVEQVVEYQATTQTPVDRGTSDAIIRLGAVTADLSLDHLASAAADPVGAIKNLDLPWVKEQLHG